MLICVVLWGANFDYDNEDNRFFKDVGLRREIGVELMRCLEVAKSPEAKKSGILLMMNKIDLFKVKVKEDMKSFKKVFPDYSGGTERSETKKKKQEEARSWIAL